MKNLQLFIAAFVLSFLLSGCQQTGQKTDHELEQQSALEPADPLMGATEAPSQVDAKSHSSSIDCGKLSQQQCLDSQSCIVDKAKKKGYVCRIAQDVCEQNFAQSSTKVEKICKANGKTYGQRCYFRPASCFCPEGMQCICGGGLPAMCTSRPIENTNPLS